MLIFKMFLRRCVLLSTLVILSLIIIVPADARKGISSGRHSYPKSGGLSGGGHSSHGYPSSGGMSGGGHGYPSSSGGNHGYPSSGGLSGGGSGYPSSGGSHGYPSSGGSPGYPSSGGNRGYPSSGGSHTYPSSGNSHGYPSSNGMSGGNRPAAATHTNVYNNYKYTPPQQIRYTPVGGGAPVSYPVYHGTPPTYVYQVKDSGSKYGTLLAGLALLNLGTLAGVGVAYASSHSGSSSSSYKAKPGEVCLFGIKKDNGDYEETRIDCQLMSSFILQEEAKTPNATNTSVVTTTVTNVTMVNTTNGASETATTTAAPGKLIYEMLPNGTLVPLNATSANSTTNATAVETSANNTMTSSVTITTTTTNTTVTNALDVKGKPVTVTPGMQCFVIRTTPSSKMKKTVPCGLLQTYAEKSISKNAANRIGPLYTMLAVVFAVAFVY